MTGWTLVDRSPLCSDADLAVLEVTAKQLQEVGCAEQPPRLPSGMYAFCRMRRSINRCEDVAIYLVNGGTALATWYRNSYIAAYTAAQKAS